MSTGEFRILEPGQGKTLPLPMMENLDAEGLEKLVVFSSESFAEIFERENPMALWAVFLTCTALDGKRYASLGHSRLPRDTEKRLACLRCAKDMFPVGAIWLKTSGDQIGYALLELPMRLYPQERNEKLLNMIHELVKTEFGQARTLIVDNAFE